MFERFVNLIFKKYYHAKSMISKHLMARHWWDWTWFFSSLHSIRCGVWSVYMANQICARKSEIHAFTRIYLLQTIESTTTTTIAQEWKNHTQKPAKKQWELRLLESTRTGWNYWIKKCIYIIKRFLFLRFFCVTVDNRFLCYFLLLHCLLAAIA